MQERRLSLFLSLAAGAAFLVLIWPEIPVRSLEYDEIWTQQFYVSAPLKKTLTDLATPNNQMLHTLCCKGVESLFGEGTLTLRFTAFLAMAALLLFAGIRGAVRLPAGGGLFLVAALGCSGGLIHYAGTARGYTLQCFFVFLLLAALLVRPRSVRRTLLVLGGAAAACLTVSSGAVYAGALIGSYLFVMLPWRRGWLKQVWRERGVWLLPLLFVLTWYGCFYAQLRSAQQFGEALSGVTGWFAFCSRVTMKLGIGFYLLLTAAGCCVRGRYRRFAVMTLLAVFFVLASAWLTKAGPERVYLPLIPVAAAGAAAGAANWCCRMRRRKMAFYLYLLLAFIAVFCREGEAARWEVPDAGVEATKLMQTLPEGVYPVYSPTASLPAVVNQPGIRDFCGARLRGKLTRLRFVDTPSGALPPAMTPVDLATVSEREIELLPLRNGMPLEGKLLVAVCRDAYARNALLRVSRGKPWLLANLWFGTAADGVTVWFLENAPGRAGDYLDAAGMVDFYRSK